MKSKGKFGKRNFEYRWSKDKFGKRNLEYRWSKSINISYILWICGIKASNFKYFIYKGQILNNQNLRIYKSAVAYQQSRPTMNPTPCVYEAGVGVYLLDYDNAIR